uniref:Uncharacterized protein n=1 Tax=Physcomitrium patens TaxID=3218 RepID=A0A2K1KWA3_PHYPA|nr:hypothetical protein PHYPA_005059 [Physcomitrium patens]
MVSIRHGQLERSPNERLINYFFQISGLKHQNQHISPCLFRFQTSQHFTAFLLKARYEFTADTQHYDLHNVTHLNRTMKSNHVASHTSSLNLVADHCITGH